MSPVKEFPSVDIRNYGDGRFNSMLSWFKNDARSAGDIILARKRPQHQVILTRNGHRLAWYLSFGLFKNRSGSESAALFPKACRLEWSWQWDIMMWLPLWRILLPSSISQVRNWTDAANDGIQIVSSHSVLRFEQELQSNPKSIDFAVTTGWISSRILYIAA